MAEANQDISSRNLSVEAWITIVLNRRPFQLDVLDDR